MLLDATSEPLPIWSLFRPTDRPDDQYQRRDPPDDNVVATLVVSSLSHLNPNNDSQEYRRDHQARFGSSHFVSSLGHRQDDGSSDRWAEPLLEDDKTEETEQPA